MAGSSKSTMVAMVRTVLIALALALGLPGYAAGATLGCVQTQVQELEASRPALRLGCCDYVTAVPVGALESNSRVRFHQPIVSDNLSAVYPRAHAGSQLGLSHAGPLSPPRRIYVLTQRLRL